MAAELGHQIQSPCSLLLKRRRTEDVPLPTADEIGRLYHSLLNSNPITTQPLSDVVPDRSLPPAFVAKRVPPSHQAFDQRLCGPVFGREEASDLRRKHHPHQQFDMPADNNGLRSCGGIRRNAASWQNTEEEEFNWEDVRRPPIVDSTPSAYQFNKNHMGCRYHQESRNHLSQYPYRAKGREMASLISRQQFDNTENKVLSSRNMPQVGYRHAQSHIAPSQQNAVPSATLSHHAALALNQAHSSPQPFPIQNIPNNAFRGAPSVVSQSQNTGSVVSNQPGSVFSGLINSLMSQGLIFLPKEAPAQDSAITEFNGDLLKVRHESVINALYGDLPRQCTTCSLRFKCKEEHSKHMDWHVTKNRASRNRKQKSSRKWYVTVSMYVSVAETVGKGAAYFPTATMEEQKINDKDMVVAADEDQKTCALCGEAFDDFYSDEAEEWMYKGAVYMNGSAAAGMDRSQLGPIVHAKCRSASP